MKVVREEGKPLVSKTVFIGNPGAGKSTLLNAAIGKAVFQSGLSIGCGLTQRMKMVDMNGNFWGDTPGLDDVMTRDQTVKEIIKTFRNAEGSVYRLVFVVTLESGRLRAVDLATVQLVLDAISYAVNEKIIFGVIVNKIEPEVKKALEESKEDFDAFMTTFGLSGYKPSEVFLYPMVEELVEADNALHEEPPTGFLGFLERVQPMSITSSQVQDINDEDFEALKANYLKTLYQKQTESPWFRDPWTRKKAIVGVMAGVVAITAFFVTGIPVEPSLLVASTAALPGAI